MGNSIGPRAILVCVMCFTLVALAACGGSRPLPPVVERDAAPPRRIDFHIVAPGETLYSIGWRYGLDVSRLAHANNLGDGSRIRAGQRLTLDLSRVPGPSASGIVQAPTQKRTPTTTDTPHRPTIPSQPLASQWRWPAQGPVVTRFGSGAVAHKGIDIRGEFGEPVVATNNGVVVYAGSGLIGYGNLIILKHNERYLSAYGHNSRLLVAEGQRVKAGEQIAEIGDSGTDFAKLHFEVREYGRPVDPIALLPRR